jgi:hypothetical protein
MCDTIQHAQTRGNAGGSQAEERIVRVSLAGPAATCPQFRDGPLFLSRRKSLQRGSLQ